MTDINVGLRDSYGFEINKKYAEFYKKFAGVWEQEETERVHNWLEFFQSNTDLLGDTGADADVDSIAVQEAILEKFFSTVERGKLQAPNTKVLFGLVHSGVPFQLRGKAWKIFLGLKGRKVQKLYEQLVERSLGPLKTKKYLDLEDIKGRCNSLLYQKGEAPGNDEDEANGPGQQQEFPDLASPRSNSSKLNVKAWVPSGKDFLGQIEKDLHRTFPGNQLMDKTGRCALRRILAAYSVYNPKVGYCQGMNFLAGCFLLFMDEEDAFWCLTAMVDEVVPGYFSMAMVAPQVDQKVFKQLVEHELPSLHQHLEALGADVCCVFAQWFLCSFVNSLPLEICLRVWDVMFLEKSSLILFKVGLALVAIYSSALLSLNDLLEACDLLQSIAPMTYDGSKLLEVALYGYEHISFADLSTLREINRKSVIAELEKAAASVPQKPATDLRDRLQQELDKPVVVVKDTVPEMEKALVPEPSTVAAGAASSGEDAEALSSHQVNSEESTAPEQTEASDNVEEEIWHKTPRWESLSQFNDMAQESMMQLAKSMNPPKRISYNSGDLSAFAVKAATQTSKAASSSNPTPAVSAAAARAAEVLDMGPEDELGRSHSVQALGEALGVSAIFDHYQSIADSYKAPRASSGVNPASTSSDTVASASGAATTAEQSAERLEQLANADPVLLDQLVTAVQQLESELWVVEKKRVDAEAVVQHYSGIIHLLKDKVEYLLSLLTEKDKLILVLTDKLNKVLSELAEQDTDIAEKDDQINELRKALRLLESRPRDTKEATRLLAEAGNSNGAQSSPTSQDPSRSKLSSIFKVLRLQKDTDASDAPSQL